MTRLFDPSCDPHEELLRLHGAVHELLEGLVDDSSAWGLQQLTDGAGAAVARAVLSRRAPTATLEVAAGLAAVCNPKDYHMVPYWNAAWQLTAELDVQPVEPAGSRISNWLHQQLDLAARICSGEIAARTNVHPELTHTFERVALMGAGGQVCAKAEQARPILFLNQQGRPYWTALRAAFDVVGAGSREGVDTLAELAGHHQDSPALLWLDCVAATVADEPRHKEARENVLRQLASGRFGTNADQLVVAIRLAFQHIDKEGSALPESWRELNSSSREPVAAVSVQGPFLGLHAVKPDVMRVMDDVCHYCVLGFRELYGLQLLREGMPRLGVGVA